MAETLRPNPGLWIAKTDKGNEIIVRANVAEDLGRTTVRRGNDELAFPQTFSISFSPRVIVDDAKLAQLQKELQKEAEANELPKPAVAPTHNLSIDWPGLRFSEVDGVVELLSSRLGL